MSVMTTAAVIGAAGTVYGVASSADASRKAANAAKDAANAPTPTVDINGLQTQAQNIAQQNAANSAALEQQYNPGAAELRAGSLAALNNLGTTSNPQLDALIAQVAAQAGNSPYGVSYNSPLLQQAIKQASQDLTLGGALPKDVQNLVARQALARSGSTTQGLGLGRDITARDLGLTSLQLAQQRLQNASQLGGQQSSQGLANANYDLQSQLAGTNNLFNSANFLQSVANGNFANALSAAQLGQSIQQPSSGLDPGSIANIAIGNTNATAQQQQNASALQAQAAAGQSQFGGQLIGAGLGALSNYKKTSTPAVTYNPYNLTYTSNGYVPPSTSYTSMLPSTLSGL